MIKDYELNRSVHFLNSIHFHNYFMKAKFQRWWNFIPYCYWVTI